MCITYRREEYISRIVEQFITQDYVGAKEFVILNDDPDVNYICNHPEVNIYNLDHRFINKRAKFNFGASLCSGRIFIPVGDDDIFEPHQMRMMVEALGNDKFCGFNGYWIKNLKNNTTKWMDDRHGALYACKMDYFKELGGYMEWKGETDEERAAIPIGTVTENHKNTQVCGEVFMGRVMRRGDYKEILVSQDDAFFTWVRGTSRSGYTDINNKDKYIVRERNPKIITIELDKRKIKHSGMMSWMCITYKREEYVPKIVEQFLLQDYEGEKEFVILNDDPDVKYVCDHPEIKIHNWDHRFKNRRTKFNVGVSLCSGSVFIAIADDDLHAPHQIRKIVEALGNDKFLGINGFRKQIIGTEGAWIQEPIGGFYACRIDYFKEMGGYMEWVGETEEERSSVPLGKFGRDKVSREVSRVAPEAFMGRVMKKGDYKELFVNEEDSFFTWVRCTDHSAYKDKNPDKYIIKERDPKIITIRGKI